MDNSRKEQTTIGGDDLAFGRLVLNVYPELVEGDTFAFKHL
jgi:hypothetical protein